jgi:hypothetical protein
MVSGRACTNGQYTTKRPRMGTFNRGQANSLLTEVRAL